MSKLEDLIRLKIPFTHKTASTGFEPVICQVCNDYKFRGGFKFDAGTIGYNCFNCGASGTFTEGSTFISKDLRNILNAFSITSEEIDQILGSNFIEAGGLVSKIKEEKEITIETLTKNKKSFDTPEVQLPEGSIKIDISNPTPGFETMAVEYLAKRKVLTSKHDFYFSNDKFKNRIIFPFKRNGKIIFWQARAIFDDMNPRYISCGVHKTAVFYNYDELNNYSNLPLFVTEGIFDAIPLNGVAVIGSTLNDVKIEILKRVRRKIVFVIQRDSNGKSLAHSALENGFNISFPPEGYNDVNKAVCETGLSWTVNNIMNNISSSISAAKLAIELNCRT